MKQKIDAILEVWSTKQIVLLRTWKEIEKSLRELDYPGLYIHYTPNTITINTEKLFLVDEGIVFDGKRYAAAEKESLEQAIINSVSRIVWEKLK